MSDKARSVAALLAAHSLVLVATATAHMPALGGDILGWDDRRALMESVGWRGLGWPQLRYAFTSFDMGMYRPLTWLSYGADYARSGLVPAGFHWTNVLVHLLVAILLLWVVREWLLLAGQHAWFWPAVMATLAFSLHPLRVQVVAWISARADALAAALLLAATLAWLRWLNTPRPATRVAWHVFFFMSLLAKPAALLAPAVWWLAHTYLERKRQVQRAPAVLDVAIGGLIAAGVALPLIAAKQVLRKGGGVPTLPWTAPFTALHNSIFPLFKTLWPHPLGFYEPEFPFRLFAARYVLGAVVALALAATIWRLRAALPGLATSAACYVLLLVPVLGLLPFGYELVADRFSYVPMLVASVAAAVVGTTARARGAIVVGLWLCVMGVLSFRQAHVWADTETLWAHNFRHFPDSALANAGMGDSALAHQQWVEARRFYERARTLQPEYTNVYLGMGFIDIVEEQHAQAIVHLQRYLAHRPDNVLARKLIMHAYERVGRQHEAAAIREMLQLEAQQKAQRY